MGNKYGSNIRTYTARNLVWDVSGGQPVPYTINAPNALTIEKDGMLPVFYRAQYPLDHDWHNNSKVSVKRAGIFCNFADGLVQKMDTSRVSMEIKVIIARRVQLSGNGVVFTEGSNIITGTDLSPLNVNTIVCDRIGGNIPYYMQADVTAPLNPGYITDYAIASSVNTALYKYDIIREQAFTIYNVATLNTLYECELFFPYCPLQDEDRMFLSCKIDIDGPGTSLDFYTKSIDTLFNGSPVSFDSVMELEITPYAA